MPKSSRRFRISSLLLAAAIGLGTATPAHAQDVSDASILLTGRLLNRTIKAGKNAPLKNSAEAGEVLMALRSTRDKGLLPVFQTLRDSKADENKIFAMVALAILAKDAGIEPTGPLALDFKTLFSTKDAVLQTSALGSLINAHAISEQELKIVLTTAPEAIQRAMAAGELSVMKKLDDRSGMLELLKNDKAIVKYEAALTILDGGQPADEAAALDVIKKLSAGHDLRMAQIEALMFERMQKEKLKAALPWAVQVASDEAVDIGLRYSALAALLTFRAPEGPKILTDMIQTQKDALEHAKMGLMSIEFADQIKKEFLAPIVVSKSALARSIATIAQKAADKQDVTADLIALIKEGHPLVMDWAYQYSGRAAPDRRLALRAALVNQATMVDNVRDRDYERAALAAERILEEDGPAGRKVISGLLFSENRAVVDATLSGIYRSSARDQAEFILQIWGTLSNPKTPNSTNSANYAALILAREGRKEPIDWLPKMVVGGTVQGPGFRSLAGWYYAKLTNQTDKLLKAALAE